VVGIACIYWPAGLIVAGILLLVWSAMVARACGAHERTHQ
jgi:hypothetical protein